jgi:hypothetical protein
MKRLIPAVIAGPFLGVACYAMLRLLTPASAGTVDDPWAEHFRRAGFEARLRDTSRDPTQHFSIIHYRDRFRDPELARTAMRTVEVDRWDLQIAEFPSEELAASVVEEEGRRKIPNSEKPHLVYHVQRVGRWIGTIRPFKDHFQMRNVPDDAARRILSSFAQRAREIE